MQWLVTGAKPNDSLFFHCELVVSSKCYCSTAPADSGHGGQIKDTDGDEFDGYDEGGNIAKCRLEFS